VGVGSLLISPHNDLMSRARTLPSPRVDGQGASGGEGAPPFSIAVIARDEARALPRLLEALAPFVASGGDVVVVDTGSGDATAALARAAGCRVAEEGDRFASALDEASARAIEGRFARGGEGPVVAVGARVFRFAEARERASALARRDWVLQLDAGDELLAFDAAFLGARIRERAPRRLSYALRLGGATLRVSRFCDRRRARWAGRAHEALRDIGAGEPPLEVSPDRLLIRHHKQEKPRSYLAGLALDALEAPGDPRWLHYVGRELHYLGFPRSALAALEEHARRDDAWTPERGESLCLAGERLEALGDPSGALERYERACAVDASRREPLLRLAGLRGRLGDFAGSVAAARRALEVPRTSAFVEADANYGARPHALLYWGLFWLGERAEARAHWEECLRLDPEDASARAHARLFAT